MNNLEYYKAGHKEEFQAVEALVKRFSLRCAGSSQLLLNRLLALQCAEIVVKQVLNSILIAVGNNTQTEPELKEHYKSFMIQYEIIKLQL